MHTLIDWCCIASAGRPAFAYANNNTCRGSPFPTNYVRKTLITAAGELRRLTLRFSLQTGQCVYEDEIFTNEVINRINLHPADVVRCNTVVEFAAQPPNELRSLSLLATAHVFVLGTAFGPRAFGGAAAVL